MGTQRSKIKAPRVDYLETLLAEKELREFVRQSFPIIEPKTKFVWGWHIDAICDHLQAVTKGQIRNLIILVPPRHMKSITVSVAWPAWEWIQNPAWKYLYSAYAYSLSIRDSVKFRRLIQSDWYQARWGKSYYLIGEPKQKIENNLGGYRLATSVGGAVTGQGGDRLVCLPYGTLITTSRGKLPIGYIVKSRLPVSVLSFNHRTGATEWQSIKEYEESVGRPSIKVKFSDGSCIVPTDDHPVFVKSRGYVKAIDLRPGDEVLDEKVGTHISSLPAVREDCTQVQEKDASKWGVLLARLSQSSPSSASVAGRVQLLRKGTIQESQACCESFTVLFQSLLGRVFSGDRIYSQAASAVLATPGVPEKSLGSFNQVLFSAMCEYSSSSENVRARQFKLQAWSRNKQQASCFQRSQTKSKEARPLSVCCLHVPEDSSASSEWESARQRLEQSSDTLLQLSQFIAHDGKTPESSSRRVVASIRRVEAPEKVYNLKVACNHNYFANSLLVHNCDDPHSLRWSESETIRASSSDWWDNVMSTRGNDPKTVAKVIIMQRCHEEDLAGHCITKGTYEMLVLPAEYEPKRRCTTIIGFEDPRVEEGDLLWPERFSREEVDKLKRELGTYAAAAQLQQRPAPSEGGIIKKGWWRFWTSLPVKFDEMIQSWDCTFKDLKTSDYVVGQIWGRKGSDKYLIDQTRGQMRFTKTLEEVIRLTKKYPKAAAKLIEDKANGTAVIDSLRAHVSGIIPITPKESKLARLEAVSPQIEAGNVYVPDPALNPWVESYLEEFSFFPFAAHDDQVDATSQALARLSKHERSMQLPPLHSAEKVSSFRSMSPSQGTGTEYTPQMPPAIAVRG